MKAEAKAITLKIASLRLGGGLNGNINPSKRGMLRPKSTIYYLLIISTAIKKSNRVQLAMFPGTHSISRHLCEISFPSFAGNNKIVN